MHEYLVWLEGTAFSTWVKESGSVWAYPTILTLHTMSMGALVGAILVLNLRVLGVAAKVPLHELAAIFRAFWLGAAVSALTGVVLFCADATTKGTTPVFFVKLGFIAIALVVAKMQRTAVFGPGTDDQVASGRARLLAIASLICWTGAITAGRFMAYLTKGPLQS